MNILFRICLLFFNILLVKSSTNYNVKLLSNDKNEIIYAGKGFTEFPVITQEDIQKLDLSNNNLQSVKEINLKNCGNLKTLRLQNNNISTIEEYSFAYTILLKLLDLSGNQLTIIPDIIITLPFLEQLYLRRNLIHRFNYVGSYRSKLRRLDLSENPLYWFNLDKFPRLQDLGLNDTNLHGFHFTRHLFALAPLCSLSDNVQVPAKDNTLVSIATLKKMFGNRSEPAYIYEKQSWCKKKLNYLDNPHVLEIKLVKLKYMPISISKKHEPVFKLPIIFYSFIGLISMALSVVIIYCLRNKYNSCYLRRRSKPKDKQGIDPIALKTLKENLDHDLNNPYESVPFPKNR